MRLQKYANFRAVLIRFYEELEQLNVSAEKAYVILPEERFTPEEAINYIRLVFLGLPVEPYFIFLDRYGRSHIVSRIKELNALRDFVNLQELRNLYKAKYSDNIDLVVKVMKHKYIQTYTLDYNTARYIKQAILAYVGYEEEAAERKLEAIESMEEPTKC